ncbi:protein REVEILLE 6-like [Olea europaea var. sylvestris]|uniref:REVEILLE 6 isoform X1 n=1 Tax=Olea europaea subsp. europaea TaxID=158383 RepID=A0A8S0TZP5_OLEEU|nr:protein REVEILLE 6-like [Olea europaea var. sylvestris]CAA3011086.1 REVEILLE 6 isoform X1 [Olea europaea subsp. europaea]
MVSVCRNPVRGQDFCYYNYMDGEPMKTGTMAMRNADNNLLIVAESGNAGAGVEDQNKKVRKPYTITKSRESWTEQEHDKFLEALQLFDREWKKIEAFVGSKTVIQIRSHAQKYFLKAQKNGTSEHVPPPRPKRKAAHPYPQKAPKKVVSQATGSLQSSASLLEPGYVVRPDQLSVPGNTIDRAALSPWTYNVVPAGSMSHMSRDDMGLASLAVTRKCSRGSNESTPQLLPSNESNSQVKEKQGPPTKVMPDFAKVYSFIGSVFDPNASDHLERLKKMDQINVATAVMLMKNLSINLMSPEFENHRKMLSSHSVGIEEDRFDSPFKNLQVDKLGNVITTA